MRILVAIETDVINKGPHQTHHLMERLSLRGHEVRIIDFEILWRGNAKRKLTSRRLVITGFSKAMKNSQIEIIRPSILHMPILDYASEIVTHGIEIWKQIVSFKPDVIIGFSILNTYIAMRLAKLVRIPFVYYLIDSQHAQIPEKYLRLFGKFIESRIARNADRTIVINEELRRYAIGLGGEPSRIQIIRAGIEPAQFNPKINGEEIRRKYGIEKDEIVLFFMGWLYTFSGLEEVAHSIQNYSGNSKFRLIVLGKGDLLGELEKMRRTGLGDKLILADWQPYEEVPKYIAASDICLLPSHNNDVMRYIVPIKMYEYMACGKPVISSRLPGIIKEFGHGNGVVYIDRSEDALEKADLLAKDREAMREIGTKAANYVRKYTWVSITDQFETILKGLAMRYHALHGVTGRLTG